MKNTPLPLPYTKHHSPHVLIEVNHHCNIKCRACYKTHIPLSRNIPDIIADISFAESKRCLDLITLAGGEPTLHPEIVTILEYIKKSGYNSSILTNGTLLEDGLLKKYKKAGLGLLYIHIDTGQKRPDLEETENMTDKELFPLRDHIFNRTYRYNILSALAITLYKSRLKELKDVFEYTFSRKTVKGLLVLTYQDHARMIKSYKREQNRQKQGDINTVFSQKFEDRKISWSGQSEPDENVTNEEIEEYVYHHFHIKPDFYLPSNLDKQKKKWLLYTPFLINLPDQKYKLLPVSRPFRRFILTMIKHKNRFKNGSYTIYFKLSPFMAFIACLISGFISFSPRYFGKMITFLLHLFIPGSTILMKDIVCQEGPTVNKEGQLEHCNYCPDATVRNETLIPVCLVDFVSPHKKK